MLWPGLPDSYSSPGNSNMQPRVRIIALRSSGGTAFIAFLCWVPWFLGLLSSIFLLYFFVFMEYYLVAAEEKMHVQVLACLKLSLLSSCI